MPDQSTWGGIVIPEEPKPASPTLLPLGTWMLCERLEAETTLGSGVLELPDEAVRQPNAAVVLATGPGRVLNSGARHEVQLAPGDLAVYEPHDYRPTTDDGREGYLADEALVAVRRWKRGDWGGLEPCNDYVFLQLDALPTRSEGGIEITRHSLGGEERARKQRALELLAATRDYPVALGVARGVGRGLIYVRFTWQGVKVDAVFGPWGVFRIGPGQKLRSVGDLQTHGLLPQWDTAYLQRHPQPVLVVVPPKVVLQQRSWDQRAMWWASLADDHERLKVIREFLEPLPTNDLDALCRMLLGETHLPPPPIRLLEHSLTGRVCGVGPGFVGPDGKRFDPLAGPGVRALLGRRAHINPKAGRVYLSEGERSLLAIRAGELEAVEDLVAFTEDGEAIN